MLAVVPKTYQSPSPAGFLPKCQATQKWQEYQQFHDSSMWLIPWGAAQDFVSAVMDVDYSPTGREFVAGSYDRSIRIFGFNSGHSKEVSSTTVLHSSMVCVNVAVCVCAELLQQACFMSCCSHTCAEASNPTGAQLAGGRMLPVLQGTVSFAGVSSWSWL